MLTAERTLKGSSKKKLSTAPSKARQKKAARELLKPQVKVIERREDTIHYEAAKMIESAKSAGSTIRGMVKYVRGGRETSDMVIVHSAAAPAFLKLVVELDVQGQMWIYVGHFWDISVRTDAKAAKADIAKAVMHLQSLLGFVGDDSEGDE